MHTQLSCVPSIFDCGCDRLFQTHCGTNQRSLQAVLIRGFLRLDCFTDELPTVLSASVLFCPRGCAIRDVILVRRSAMAQARAMRLVLECCTIKDPPAHVSSFSTGLLSSIFVLGFRMMALSPSLIQPTCSVFTKSSHFISPPVVLFRTQWMSHAM